MLLSQQVSLKVAEMMLWCCACVCSLLFNKPKFLHFLTYSKSDQTKARSECSLQKGWLEM